MGKPISQRKRLAAIFASFTILGVGTLSLLQNMAIDYYSVLGTLEKALPASLMLGGLGWVMGMILDRPKRRVRKQFNDLYLQTFAHQALSDGNDNSAENAGSDIASDIEPNINPNIV